MPSRSSPPSIAPINGDGERGELDVDLILSDDCVVECCYISANLQAAAIYSELVVRGLIAQERRRHYKYFRFI